MTQNHWQGSQKSSKTERHAVNIRREREKPIEWIQITNATWSDSTTYVVVHTTINFSLLLSHSFLNSVSLFYNKANQLYCQLRVRECVCREYTFSQNLNCVSDARVAISNYPTITTHHSFSLHIPTNVYKLDIFFRAFSFSSMCVCV